MDIAQIVNTIVEGLNNDSGCGLCWKFIFGGRSDYFNNARPDCTCETCCVALGVFKVSSRTIYKTEGEFINKHYTDWSIEMFAGIPSTLDIQFYNEIRPDDIVSSKWVKFLNPIRCCLESMDIDFCDIYDRCKLGESTIEIQSWETEMKINYLDQNYDGWFIKTTIREWLER